MTAKLTTNEDAINQLHLQNDNTAVNTYETYGVAPACLVKHTEKKTFNILGMTPKDFIKTHGSVSFDFDDLIKKFSKICIDYEQPLDMNEASKAVEFCSKIIYEVGPEARLIKKKDGDKTGKFCFMYEMHNKLVVKVAFVSTFKDEQNEYELIGDIDKINLTVKNASLLAILTLNSY